MDHPLLTENQKDLRRRVINLIRAGFDVRRAGNIIFVCGGNSTSHMRVRFCAYCASDHDELEIFQPEYAMENLLSLPSPSLFNIASFEELIADLSFAVVIFPEAPGSYAETGYFSAVGPLAEKTLLVLDLEWQSSDSFISMGPARKLDSTSIFANTMYISYNEPEFSGIIKRLQRYPLPKNNKLLSITKFGQQSNYELFCIIDCIVDLLRLATIDDIFSE